jgi:hypothetical protein
VLYAVVLFTNIIMNSVQSIKNLKTAVGLGFEERKEIKQLGPPRPNLKICKQNLIKGKIVVRNFNRGTVCFLIKEPQHRNLHTK